MIIVNLKGGLGNQMFEYAAGRRLAVKHNVELKLDTTFLLDRNPSFSHVFRDFDLDIFPNVNPMFASIKEIALLKSYINRTFRFRILNRLNAKPGLFKEIKFSYHEDFEKLGPDTYLDGYWQSDKYFKPIEAIIRKDFSFAPFTLQKNFELANKITVNNSVCINIRRGDFVNDKHSNKRHGFVGLEYVANAVKLVSTSVQNPSFYVFSDEIEWCKENIKLPFPTIFIDNTHAGDKFADYLQLMTLCKHFIIPNSSFAWWAAWLNTNPDKIVVAPKKWFNNGPTDTQDILPEGWIKL
jgi:hypothetical protein